MIEQSAIKEVYGVALDYIADYLQGDDSIDSNLIDKAVKVVALIESGKHQEALDIQLPY